MSLPQEVAAAVLRRSRHAAGLTQAQLAELAGTSQSAIAAYESGTRLPTLPVLRRMIEATGHVVRVTIEPDPALFRLTDVAREIRTVRGDVPRRLRLVFEFLRAAEQDGHPLALLVAAEPEATGDRRFDALLAAAAEDLCVGAGMPPPSWVYEPSRFLDSLVGERSAVQASTYVSGRAGRGTPVYDHPNLRVLSTPPEHLLAMKVRAAARAVRDAGDLRLLLRTLDVATVERAVEIVERYFPDEPLSPRSRQMLEDVLDTIE